MKKKETKKEQIHNIIQKFGGVRSTARIINRTPSAISHWKTRKQIPLECIKDLLVAAKKLKIELTADELIF